MEREEQAQEVLSPSQQQPPAKMAKTENDSLTFSTTESACLDFYFEVMQHTDQFVIIENLTSAWKENPTLTLKLIFQLRDIRHGKGAMIAFHHCLLWMFEHHPLTLISNLQYLPTHGYWRDLCWLIKFLVEGKVATTTEKNKRIKQRKRQIPSFRLHYDEMSTDSGDEDSHSDEEEMMSESQPEEELPAPVEAEVEAQPVEVPAGIPQQAPEVVPSAPAVAANPALNCSFESLLLKRVNGLISKKDWKGYLKGLPNNEARQEAKAKLQETSKKVHLARSLEAKARKKAAKLESSTRLSNFRLLHQHFPALYDEVVRLFCEALLRDRETLKRGQGLDSTALAGKWAPSIGGAIDKKTDLGKAVARALYASSAEPGKETQQSMTSDQLAFILYRKEFLTPLRKCIKVPEVDMSSNKWSDIQYDRVPSVCMKRNKEVFVKRDKERFQGYLKDVETGKKKIASGALLPHEIVRQFMSFHGYYRLQKKEAASPESEQVAELQWDSYVNNLKKAGLLQSCLPVCDVSGSMHGEPMEVAIALSLLTAAVSKPPFDGLICSFHESPSLHQVNQATLKEKVQFTQKMEWGGSTNMQAVFDLILKRAVESKLPKEEMVQTIFVFSDMEFDDCGGDKYETDYQMIQRKFAEAGYPLPGIVFWNLRGGKRSKPVTKDEKNVALVSGFSGQMMKTFLENGTFISPYETMLDSLGTRYDHLKVCD